MGAVFPVVFGGREDGVVVQEAGECHQFVCVSVLVFVAAGGLSFGGILVGQFWSNFQL